MRQLTLSLRPDTILVALDVTFERRVHVRHCRCSTVRLELAQIFWSEQELTVQIALLDCVQVGDVDDPLLPACQTHHAPVLQHLTSDGTRADEELPLICDLVLESLAKDSDLTVVAGPKRLTIRLGRLLSGH